MKRYNGNLSWALLQNRRPTKFLNLRTRKTHPHMFSGWLPGETQIGDPMVYPTKTRHVASASATYLADLVRGLFSQKRILE